MRMTMEEFLMWPKDISLEEYLKQLEAQKKKDKRIRRLANERDDLEDCLSVLQDEQGSERYIKKARRLEKVKEEIERLIK